MGERVARPLASALLPEVRAGTAPPAASSLLASLLKRFPQHAAVPAEPAAAADAAGPAPAAAGAAATEAPGAAGANRCLPSSEFLSPIPGPTVLIARQPAASSLPERKTEVWPRLAAAAAAGAGAEGPLAGGMEALRLHQSASYTIESVIR